MTVNMSTVFRLIDYTDIDECSEETDSCDQYHGMCTNTPGNYTCSCEIGYTGNGFICTGKCCYYNDMKLVICWMLQMLTSVRLV